MDTIEILSVLIKTLSHICDQRNVFESQRAAYFGGMDSRAQETLQSIQDIFLELEVLRRDFDHLRDSCENLRNEVGLPLLGQCGVDKNASSDR